uniref:Pentraxin family member n=1 Tax=Sander lucioperca TaxID=283035 RepID=A0A8C9YVD1_SANLU
FGLLVGLVSIKTLVFPSETSTSYVEMVPQKPLNLRAFTLCMRVATELTGKREIIRFAYRTQSYDELNVWRELDGRLSFYLAGEPVFFRVPEIGALQTHLCVTWDSSSGAAALFMDGRKSLTKIYNKGHTVQPGGKVIIGQDPDNYVGSFDARVLLGRSVILICGTPSSQTARSKTCSLGRRSQQEMFSTGKPQSLTLTGRWWLLILSSRFKAHTTCWNHFRISSKGTSTLHLYDLQYMKMT